MGMHLLATHLILVYKLELGQYWPAMCLLIFFTSLTPFPISFIFPKSFAFIEYSFRELSLIGQSKDFL